MNPSRDDILKHPDRSSSAADAYVTNMWPMAQTGTDIVGPIVFSSKSAMIIQKQNSTSYRWQWALSAFKPPRFETIINLDHISPLNFFVDKDGLLLVLSH